MPEAPLPPPPPLATAQHLPQAVVIHVQTRYLGEQEVIEVFGIIDKAISAAPALPFILDVTNVGLMGSMAMGRLITLSQNFRARSQRLIIVSLQSNVRGSFQVARMHRVIEILPDLPSALQTLRA
ncbi:MAG TPA: STAS domain-containing protein [Tepidisphaeraceae bacterium]|nr:STAS domain-containing protein [Tepidisphaeraceae bacterium]